MPELIEVNHQTWTMQEIKGTAWRKCLQVLHVARLRQRCISATPVYPACNLIIPFLCFHHNIKTVEMKLYIDVWISISIEWIELQISHTALTPVNQINKVQNIQEICDGRAKEAREKRRPAHAKQQMRHVATTRGDAPKQVARDEQRRQVALRSQKKPTKFAGLKYTFVGLAGGKWLDSWWLHLGYISRECQFCRAGSWATLRACPTGPPYSS